MLQSTDPERLGKKEDQKGDRDAWIFLGTGNVRNLLGRRRAGRDGNMMNWVVEWWLEGEVKKEIS